MDRIAFEAWLRAIGAMTAAQRSVAFRVLALAEASMDAVLDVSLPAAEIVFPASDAMETADIGPTRADTPPPSLIASLASPGALASAAQARIERDGCPHCASRKLQRWGRSAGLPRYRCVDCRRSFLLSAVVIQVCQQATG